MMWLRRLIADPRATIRWTLWGRFRRVRCTYCVRMCRCEWSAMCDCLKAPLVEGPCRDIGCVAAYLSMEFTDEVETDGGAWDA